MSFDADRESSSPPPAPDDARLYLPIAVGFILLALPLWIGVFLAESNAGAWANGIAAGVMTLLGLALMRLRS